MRFAHALASVGDETPVLPVFAGVAVPAERFVRLLDSGTGCMLLSPISGTCVMRHAGTAGRIHNASRRADENFMGFLRGVPTCCRV